MSKREYVRLDYYQCQLTELPESAIVGVGDSLPLGTASRNENRPNLVSIRAVDNYLTTLPASIGKLTQLRELRLYKNRLSALPDEIANLENLIWLSLSDNRFKVFPEGIISLPRLKSLRLNDNQLTVLPASIVRMTELDYLDLSGNPIVDLSILQQLPNLRKVRFANVDLPREYSIDLRSIAKAWQIAPERSNPQTQSPGAKPWDWLFGKPVEKPAATLLQPQMERSIELTQQRLLRLPENLDLWQTVDRIDLGRNLLSTIPNTIGDLCQLKHLYLRKNKLSYLPPSIGNLSKLSNSIKKFIRPNSNGTSLDLLHADTSRTGSKLPILADTNKPRASVEAKFPARVTAIVCSSHTAPSRMPKLYGNTLTLAPVSSNAITSIDEFRYVNVSGIFGTASAIPKASNSSIKLNL